MDVLEEVTGDALSLDHVERRVDDWERRVNDLYEAITSWLPDGWSAANGEHSVLFEGDLMREVGLAARRLPILDLSKGTAHAVTIEPRGLWIIGANGRLDLRHGTARYMIVDTAENFEPHRWRFALLSDSTNRKVFDETALRLIINKNETE